MGHLMTYNSSGDQMAVVGTGKPLSDWSGLDSGDAFAPPPGQQRPLLGDAKNRTYRICGLEDKFSLKGNFKEFERQLDISLESDGQKTIAFLPDPVNKAMVNVVHDHPKFVSVDVALKQVEAQLLKYDQYDKANDVEAKLKLNNSLDASLATKLHQRIRPTDTFPVVFLRLVQLIHSQSIQYFENLKVHIRTRNPNQYSGEDIELMAMDNKDDADELDIVGQYDHNLNAVMLSNFLEVSKAEHDSYRHDLLNLSARMDKVLIEVGYMDKVAAEKYLHTERLSHVDICEAAEHAYRTLLDKDDWPGACNAVKDSKAPPSNCENPAALFTPADLDSRVYALIQQHQQKSKRDKSKDICRNCGKKGHWADECRSPAKGNKQNNGRQYNKNNKNNKIKSWKKIPPAPGALEVHTVRGKEWKWCAHCQSWSTTHGTAGHTGPKRNMELDAQANHLFVCPSAWHLPIDWDPPLAPTLFMLWSFIKFIFGGAMTILPRLVVAFLFGYSVGVNWTNLPTFFALPLVLIAFASQVAIVFGGSWVNLLAPLLWFALLVVVCLPADTQHKIVGSPPQEYRPFRMTKAKFKQYLRHYRRQRHKRQAGTHRRHSRHYRLATCQREDPSHRDFFDLIQHIISFSDAISFRRVR